MGLLGLATLCWRGIAKPGAIFRNTEVRFAFLLLAAFAGPLLAVVLLDAHLYGGQRHLFFVYAPFSLLAVLGIKWLSAAFKSRPWRAGLYGLAGLSAALLALQLTQLHPLQNLYFNPLADRKTPEHLRSHYDWDYHSMAYYEGIKWLLQAYPDRQLVVSSDQTISHRFLPPDARARVWLVDSGAADFYLTAHRKRALDTGEPRRFSNPLHTRQIYNNTILSVVTTADINARRRAEYQQLAAAGPAARSDFDLYLNGRVLTYVQETCAYHGQWLSLGILPQNPADVPRRTRDTRGYASYAVKLFPHVVDHFDGKCASAFILPSYPIAAITTGESQVWQAQIYLDLPKYRAAYDRITAGPPATSALFDLYLADDTLSYVKEPCAATDVEQPFFLDIIPQDPADLPESRRELGFASFGFNFPFPHGRLFDGKCLATFPLPDYPIKEIRTGQFDAEKSLWKATVYADLAQYRAAYQSLVSRQPTHRAIFNLYHQGQQLSYVQENCAPAAAETRFFLHLIPVEVNDLPPERRPYGMDNLDFDFFQHGRRFDGKCLAIVPLPDYPIKEIRTGQFIPDGGRIWETAFPGSGG